MDVAQARGVEGHARQEFGVGHHVPRLEVLPVLHGRRQVGADQPHGVEGAGVRDGVGGRAYVGLDGVGERVHARGGGQRLRHADHGLGVVHGQRGGDAPVHDGHLHVACLIRDDAEARHLRARACGGVHGHHRHHRLRALVHALHLPDVPAVGGGDGDGLGTVVWRAPAEGNDEVATLVFDHLEAGLHLPARWVGLAPVVDGVGDAHGLEDVGRSLHGADLHEHGVRHDQRLLVAQGLDLVHRALQRALTEDGLAGHVESRALVARGLVVVVQAVGSLRGVPCEVLGHVQGDVGAGDGLVDLLHGCRVGRGVGSREVGRARR
mmetsp:Transcript_95416/g.298227  ORF Transcript_95416/g.298227 Transcript_95416/m.298227 type:complete len:322 (+) Transcript_95416:1547-2512(+)